MIINNNNNNNNNNNVTEALNNIVTNNLFKFLFLIGSDRLLHKEGPIYDKVSCPVLVLPKGCLYLANLFLVCCTLRSESKELVSFKTLALKLSNFVELKPLTTNVPIK